MTARPPRTTTLAGPNRLVVAAATAGLVALASAGTALLVLTGTSSVAPLAAPAPPLPTSSPLSRAPGVVVLPSDEAGRLTGGSGHEAPAPHRVPSVLPVVPVALAFTDVPPVAPPVVVPPATAPELPALQRAPTPADVDATPDRPGRHLAKGHAKQAKHAKHAKQVKGHGKRAGHAHSEHRGDS